MAETSAWLVVKGEPGRQRYYVRHQLHLPRAEWESDPNRALRFASHDAAVVVADREDARVEEHIWTDGGRVTEERPIWQQLLDLSEKLGDHYLARHMRTTAALMRSEDEARAAFRRAIRRKPDGRVVAERVSATPPQDVSGDTA